MKPKRVTRTAATFVQEITRYIHRDNPAAARAYRRAVSETFAAFDERFLPRRASENLPEYVRAVTVKGFPGYTLRVAVLPDAIVLVAAFAPYLSDQMVQSRSESGLAEEDC